MISAVYVGVGRPRSHERFLSSENLAEEGWKMPVLPKDENLPLHLIHRHHHHPMRNLKKRSYYFLK